MKKIIYTFVGILISFSSIGQFNLNSFASKVDFGTTGSVQGLSTGDLNNDSKPDLVTANISSVNSISVFLNNSTTGVINSTLFSSSFTLATIAAQPINVKAIDINGDSKLDLVVTYASSSNTYFSIFLNQYNGTTFNSSSFTRYDFLAGTNPQGAAFGDFDLDGKIDIAITNYGSSNIGIYKNNSTISSLSLATPITYSCGTGPSSIIAGDIDNDGKFDLVSSNWSGNSISILRNTNVTIGTISFSSITSGNSTSTQVNPSWILLADFNNNGLKEIVVANY
jgi:hypothetical protein